MLSQPNGFLTGSDGPPPAEDEDMLGFLVAVGLDEFVANDAAGITAEAIEDFAIPSDPTIVQNVAPLLGLHHEGVYIVE